MMQVRRNNRKQWKMSATLEDGEEGIEVEASSLLSTALVEL